MENFLLIDEVQMCEAFEKYIKEGGMAGSYLYTTQEEKYQYIKEVFNTL